MEHALKRRGAADVAQGAVAAGKFLHRLAVVVTTVLRLMIGMGHGTGVLLRVRVACVKRHARSDCSLQGQQSDHQPHDKFAQESRHEANLNTKIVFRQYSLQCFAAACIYRRRRYVKIFQNRVAGSHMLEKIFSLIGNRKAPDQPALKGDAAGARPLPLEPLPEGGRADAPFDARAIDTAAAPDNQVVTSLLDIETNGTPTDAKALRLRFLRRQPVLDRSQHIVGYEFLLRNKPAASASKEDETLVLMYDQMLVKSIADLGAEYLVRGKPAFISVSPAMLDHPMIERLPR
ncbi:MAG: hypothetical protein AB1710_10525, partial [Pseudomonadota bacterium]